MKSEKKPKFDYTDLTDGGLYSGQVSETSKLPRLRNNEKAHTSEKRHKSVYGKIAEDVDKFEAIKLGAIKERKRILEIIDEWVGNGRTAIDVNNLKKKIEGET